jgi:phenylacetate-CoA ligase
LKKKFEYFDRLETRSPKTREAALMAALPKLIGHAKRRAPGFSRILSNVKPEKIKSRAALAALPVTRKSDLAELQKALPPLGGLNATPLEKLAKLFVSPGPIYEPEGHGANWWRAARGLFAGGFRAGDVVANSFAYHFTPAGWSRPVSGRPRCRSRRSAAWVSAATSVRRRSSS